MNKLFYIFLNLYFLISIPIYWNVRRWNVTQNNYFIFGILSLYVFSSFFLKQIRRFKNTWIGGFILLSLVSIFIHNFYVNKITQYYVNFSLMSEGFIYVFCGGLFFKLIYEYGNKDLRYYPMLWATLVAVLIKHVYSQSFTSLLVILSLSVIYSFISKKQLLSYCILFFLFIGAYIYKDYLVMKVFVRGAAHWATLWEIIHNPFGYGFTNSLTGNLVYINPDKILSKFSNQMVAIGPDGGYAYRHNDYLNIVRDLGILVIPLMIGFLYDFFKRLKFKSFLGFSCIVILIISFFQTTMYFPDKMIVYIPIFSLWEMSYAS